MADERGTKNNGSLDRARTIMRGMPEDADYVDAAVAAFPYSPTFIGMYISEHLRRRATYRRANGNEPEAAADEALAAAFAQIPNVHPTDKARFHQPPDSVPIATYAAAAAEAQRLEQRGASAIGAQLLDLLWEGKRVWVASLRASAGSPGDVAKRYSRAARSAADLIVQDLPEDAGGIGAAMAVADLWSRSVAVAIGVKDHDFLADVPAAWDKALDFVVSKAPHWVPRHANVLVGLANFDKGGAGLVTPSLLRKALAALEEAREFGIREGMTWTAEQAIDSIRTVRQLLGETIANEEVALSRAEALLKTAEGKGGFIAKTYFLQQAVPLLFQAGERERAERILADIRGLHEKAVEAGEFKETVIEFPAVSTAPLRAEVDVYLDPALCTDDALAIFADRYRIPGLDFPGTFKPQPSLVSQLMTRIPLVAGGRVLKPIVPGTPEAEEAVRMDQLLLQMSVATGLAFPIWIGRIAERFAPAAEDYVTFLSRRVPSLTADDHAFLLRGFRAFRDEDYVVAMHILVPRSEQVVRGALLAHPRGDATGFKDGSMKERTFGELLQRAKECSLLDEQMSTYFKLVLTEEGSGLNLRNRVAHGLLTEAECAAAQMWRVVHLLLRFAVVNTKNTGS